jgi:hypothetical protein
MAKKTVTLTNDEILAITNYCSSDDYWQKKNDSVDAELSWKTRKNRKQLTAAMDLIKEAEQEIVEGYNNDEKSKFEIDENGNQTENRIVKDEYKDEYIQKKLALFTQTQDIDVDMVDSSAFFKYNMDDTDWEMMSFMINEDDTAEEDYKKEHPEVVEGEVVE